MNKEIDWEEELRKLDAEYYPLTSWAEQEKCVHCKRIGKMAKLFVRHDRCVAICVDCLEDYYQGKFEIK